LGILFGNDPIISGLYLVERIGERSGEREREGEGEKEQGPLHLERKGSEEP